ncbi:MAG: type II toxin-antitoxin system prevent-host-death family antitoxin [Acidimicrobiaceae bacterium]|nr:type II toxin-antitoxin system prevent-host-death family antitoxin [Acidimicrobiaceae bacterium]
MIEVASRELRNRTRALLDRVAEGESMTITVHGRPVAELAPLAKRRRWMRRRQFIREVLAHQADPGLTDDLVSLADETTDDILWL